jgi:hypothetical protein
MGASGKIGSALSLPLGRAPHLSGGAAGPPGPAGPAGPEGSSFETIYFDFQNGSIPPQTLTAGLNTIAGKTWTALYPTNTTLSGHQVSPPNGLQFGFNTYSEYPIISATLSDLGVPPLSRCDEVWILARLSLDLVSDAVATLGLGVPPQHVGFTVGRNYAARRKTPLGGGAGTVVGVINRVGGGGEYPAPITLVAASDFILAIRYTPGLVQIFSDETPADISLPSAALRAQLTLRAELPVAIADDGGSELNAWVNLSPSVYLTHSAISGTGQITWKQLRLDYSLAGEGAQGAKGDAGPAGANGANGADGAPGGAPVRPPVTDCSIAWNLTGSAPYPNGGTGGALALPAYSNAVISSRQGIFGKTAALQTLSTDSKGLLRTVATAVGESPSITVAFWARVLQRKDYSVLFGKVYSGTDALLAPYYAWNFRFGVSASSTFWPWYFEVTTSGVTRPSVAASAPSDCLSVGVWAHLAATYDASTGVLTLYKDGVAIATETLSALVIDYGSHGAYEIGADFGYVPRDWEGLVEDVRVIPSAYTAAQIQALWVAGQRS